MNDSHQFPSKKDRAESRGSKRSRAIVYMLIDSVSYSLIPVLAALSSSRVAPELYVLFALITAVATYLTLYPKIIFRDAKRLFTRQTFWLAALSGFAFTISQVVLVASYQFAQNSYIPTVIFQIYPIFIVLIAIILGISSERLRLPTILLMTLALLGVLLVFYEDLSVPEMQDIIASGMALFSAIALAVNVICVIRLSPLLESIQINETASPLLANFISRIFSLATAAPLLLIFTLRPTDVNISWDGLLLVLFYGAFCLCIGSVFYFKALRITDKELSIHLLSYLSIVMSVAWLWLLGEGRLTPLILIGTACILVANILLNLRIEKSYAYTSTITWLLFGGALLFLTTGGGMEGYFNAISVPLVFFAILMAFMLDRLIKRTDQEEQYLFELVTEAETWEASSAEKQSYLKKVLKLGCETEIERLNWQHKDLCSYSTSSYSRRLLNEFLISRAQGIQFSEVAILILIGSLVLFLSVFYRPHGFVYDVFALVVSSAVVFNIMYVLDTFRNRTKRFMSLSDYGGALSINLDFRADRTMSEKIVGFGLLVAVLVIYSTAFYLSY